MRRPPIMKGETKMTDYVVVNVNGNYGYVYSFCKPEEAAETIAAAEKYAADNIARYEFCGIDCLEAEAKRLKAAKFELITFDEFLRRQRLAMLSGPVEETTAEKYEDALCVLPPLHYVTINGVTMFCLGELLTGTYARQYAKIGNRFYTAVVDTKDKTTWLHNRLS